VYLPIAPLLAFVTDVVVWGMVGVDGVCDGSRGGRGNVTTILLLRTSFSPPDARHLLGSWPKNTFSLPPRAIPGRVKTTMKRE